MQWTESCSQGEYVHVTRGRGLPVEEDEHEEDDGHAHAYRNCDR